MKYSWIICQKVVPPGVASVCTKYILPSYCQRRSKRSSLARMRSWTISKVLFFAGLAVRHVYLRPKLVSLPIVGSYRSAHYSLKTTNPLPFWPGTFIKYFVTPRLKLIRCTWGNGFSRCVLSKFSLLKILPIIMLLHRCVYDSSEFCNLINSYEIYERSYATVVAD